MSFTGPYKCSSPDTYCGQTLNPGQSCSEFRDLPQTMKEANEKGVDYSVERCLDDQTQFCYDQCYQLFVIDKTSCYYDCLQQRDACSAAGDVLNSNTDNGAFKNECYAWGNENKYIYDCDDPNTSFTTYNYDTLSQRQKEKAREKWPGKGPSYYACVQGCSGVCTPTRDKGFFG